MATQKPKMELTKNPEYKSIYVNGFFGGLNPVEGSIAFYTDRIEPKMKDSEHFGEMELDKINREMQVEIRLPVSGFIELAQWMNKHIERLEKQGILKRGDVAPPKNANLYTS